MTIDLSKVEIEELVKEINNRKKIIIPQIVKSLNESIKILKELGVEIEDGSDCDYIFDKFKITSDGDITFETIYR